MRGSSARRCLCFKTEERKSKEILHDFHHHFHAFGSKTVHPSQTDEAEFIYAHHIFIFKIVSDEGDTEMISKQTVTGLVAEHAGALSDFADSMEESEAPSPAPSVLAFESLCSFGMYGSPSGRSEGSPEDPETSKDDLLGK